MLDKGWSRRQLADASGISMDNVRNYLRGGADQPRGQTMPKLAEALGVNLRWLAWGEGPKRAIDGAPESFTSSSQPIPLLALSDAGKLQSAEELANPRLGEEADVSLGVGPRTFVVRVEDRSMAPLFLEGDMLLVDPDEPIEPGHYVVAVLRAEELALIRRWRPKARHGRSGTLIAEHQDFPDVDLDEPQGFILGRVVKRLSDV